MTASYYFFEMFVERKLRIREKLFEKLGKFMTWVIGTAVTTGIVFFIYPYKDLGVPFSAMFGATFGFYFYAAVYKLSEFVKLLED